MALQSSDLTDRTYSLVFNFFGWGVEVPRDKMSRKAPCRQWVRETIWGNKNKTLKYMAQALSIRQKFLGEKRKATSQKPSGVAH